MTMKPSSKARLTPAATNEESGVYGKFSRSATKEYGLECVRLLAMVAPHLQSPVLTDKDRVFVTDMFGKMNAHGSGFVASQAQVHWLRDVKDRLVERGEI